jgi:diaminohydroxyphosphoribosylaminopyrimidine deaminase/5-amino-6-(5-phosphoribosylamino)uracil reductase
MTTSEHMQRALDLARRVVGLTSPNPAVGCVLVKEGRVVAEAHTAPGGRPHAEAEALKAAGAAARGATAYVSLEPCSHHGQTPPCAEALIAAGVRRVVFSLTDPDPRVAGRGRAALEAAGVQVVEGDGAEESARLLEDYIKHRRTGLPFVIVKYAASLDGKIAAASGDSRWVSGPDTLAWAHEMRTRLDAIMVGVSTVVIDNPQLTARPGGVEAARQPLRVVVDSRGRTPSDAAVLSGTAPTLIATTHAASPEWKAAMKAKGGEVVEFAADEAGRVSLRPLLEELGVRGIVRLLVEGGGVLHGSFFDQRLVDKLYAVIAPLIIGAADAPGAIAGSGASRMADALHLREVTVERLGRDILITGYPEGSAAMREASGT